MKKLLLMISALVLTGCLGMPNYVEPVKDFKLDRYLGKWYEIARLDHSFERGLTQVSAEYSLKPDGGVKVINRGYSAAKQEWKEECVARLPDPTTDEDVNLAMRRLKRAKLGIEPAGVIELNALFRAQGYRKDMGVRAAEAVLFGQRFAKSKKAATSNWAAASLSEAQLLYAANDAWAAFRVAQALGVEAG